MATKTKSRTESAAKPAVAAQAKMKHLCLVDGSGYIFRAYHALPPLTRPDGMPVNAVFGFTNMLVKLLRREPRDAPRRRLRCRAAHASATTSIRTTRRTGPPPPDDLIPQFALIREATRAFGVPAIELPGYEADDMIAAYAASARERAAEVTIVSSDKDLMQLIGPGVGMLDPIKQQPIGEAEVMREIRRRRPTRWSTCRRWPATPSDNVPGVPGIGIKTAAQLISEYRRPRGAAGARRRDQAAEAARGAARQRREGAAVA